MKSLHNAIGERKSQALVDEFSEILACVQKAFDEGSTAHDVESGLWRRMLQLGHNVFQAWLDLFGDGDAGERIVLEDGREVRRLGDLHRREIRNVFGLFELMRAVYGTREGQKIEAVPLDARLQLPQELLPVAGLGSRTGGGQALCGGQPHAGAHARLHPIGAHPGT
jgi:hypothetical protein